MSDTIIWLFIALVIVVFLIWFFRCKSCGTSCEMTETPDTPQPLKSKEASDSGQAGEPKGTKPVALEKPEGEADDLKIIKGVGPKLEQTLNEQGIYHYKQIAEFTEENIQWIDEFLNFKGRIKRDNWVEQAKELAKGS